VVSWGDNLIVSGFDPLTLGSSSQGLAVLTGLWSGESFSFSGKYFHIDNTRFIPTPVQQPRIPIWVAGTWPKRPPFRRAARYDGVIPVGR
jgi:alkanesulfonate monooxygenase SsuD/methylene tetrahydromethanopterin reductase-like flavin-dependent oxidoreductase (luciferase family)